MQRSLTLYVLPKDDLKALSSETYPKIIKIMVVNSISTRKRLETGTFIKKNSKRIRILYEHYLVQAIVAFTNGQ